MMRTLDESLANVGRCLLAWLDGEKDFFPAGGYEAAHDTGRWWNAVLRMESAVGFAIPQAMEAAMLRNIQRLMGNADALLINDPEIAWQREDARINLHNFREAFGALAMLVRFRQSQWARETGHRLLETLDRCFGANGRIDESRLACWGRIPSSTDPSHAQPAGDAWFDGTGSSGRALEAIIEFYQVTGDPLAKAVAERIAKSHLANTVNRDGSPRAEILSPTNVGHNHSYNGTLRGLLAWGLMTGDAAYVDAVAATYRRALWKHHISESGWTPHDLGKIRFPNDVGEPLGEHGSCADVIDLALTLAMRCGQTELLDDVERLVRARLMPSQIVDPATPRNDGAWGVYFHPFGFGSILDVFAAVAHTLVNVREHVVTRGDDGTVTVQMHFDVDTPVATVRTERGATGRVEVVLKQSAALRIRVPRWVKAETIVLSAGRALPVRREGEYLVVSAAEAPVGQAVVLTYGLPERQSVEVMPVSGREFRLSWRGDEVVACDPPVEIYPPGRKG